MENRVEREICSVQRLDLAAILFLLLARGRHGPTHVQPAVWILCLLLRRL